MKKAAVSSILVVVVLLAVAVIAEAQQAKKVPRIGYLSVGLIQLNVSARTEGFRQGLRELGYIEGKNIVIEYRYGEGKIDRYPELATELVRLKIDIIVVAVGSVTDQCRQECHQVRFPLLWCAGNDPVEQASSPALRDLAEISPASQPLPRKLSGKRLELLKEIIPKLPASPLSSSRPLQPM